MDSFQKKTILIIIASSAAFVLLVALLWFVSFHAQFRVYHDDQYKFSIKYPRGWRVIRHPKPTVAVAFLRPKDTALDTMRENFNVTVQPLPIDISTLDGFTGTIRQQMTAVFGKGINIVEDKPLKWGWREGHEMSIEAPNPDHLKMINAWVLRGNDAFILTFLGDMNKYAKDGPVVNEMIRSLSLQ